MNSRRTWLTAVAAAAAGLALTGGCSLWSGPRTIEVTQAQLQQAVERRFPIERRYLELLDVTVAVPRVMLRPETNRVATELEVLISDRIVHAQHRGAIALDFRLRFEAGDNTVRLTDVRVERIDVQGATALLRQQLDRVGVLLAQQTLNERPVYTLRPVDVDAMQRRGLRPGDIRVTPSGLAIELISETAS